LRIDYPNLIRLNDAFVLCEIRQTSINILILFG
jgi:hypothetical protein